MLSRVVVQSENPFYLELANARPDDSIIVNRIEGLDPPDIDLFVGDYARDGGFYSGRRVGKRNPVLYLSLNPNFALGETVSGLRELLYRAFIDPNVAGDDVRVELQDDERATRYFTGYTEKIESSIFDKETDVTISMLCPNPYLLSVDESTFNVGGTTIPFLYSGTAETGLEIKVLVTSATNIVTLVLNSVWVMTLNLPTGFEPGDLIYVNTRKGERKIQLTRGGTIGSDGVISGGVTPDIYYTLTADSKWLELHKLPINSGNPTGQSTLVVYGADSSSAVANIKQIKFRAAWWGV